MVVAFFTDKVFKRMKMAIDLSMATMFLICGPISFFYFFILVENLFQGLYLSKSL